MALTKEASQSAVGTVGEHGLEEHGVTPSERVHWNLPPAHLYEESLRRGEGHVTHMGALAVSTTPHTGRSPKDRYIVQDSVSAETVDWGPVNVPISVANFEALHSQVASYLGESELFVCDARAGEDPDAGIAVRVVTPSAWHALFAHNMFLRSSPESLVGANPDFAVLHAPDLKVEPERCGTRSSAFIALSLDKRLVLIGGTRYAGEIKKSIFSVLNFLLPDRGVLPMHCSANVGREGDVALFFGLSGTGKTTLSADPERGLIGDDEHGWGPSGVFNFEGGCYAKVIRLSAEEEPEIHAATQMFGTVLENVVLDPRSGAAVFSDGSITENTRASYPIHYISNAVIPGRGAHPKTVVFLTADAFGVLPPISRLSPAQAMYHFLSGYTAKVAGTERGVTEPEATFSACFGAPFLPRHPSVYAKMLGSRLADHETKVWLVNTGWTGGGYGEGQRISIPYTRAMVRAALEGDLDREETTVDPNFGVAVPRQVPGVPPEILIPRGTWGNGAAYDEAAQRLAGMFESNFGPYLSSVSAEVASAGPAR